MNFSSRPAYPQRRTVPLVCDGIRKALIFVDLVRFHLNREVLIERTGTWIFVMVESTR